MIDASLERERVMSTLDVFAVIVLAFVIVSGIVLVVVVAALPGWVAQRRRHPWAQAVTVAGWVTLICGFVFWPVAMVWAYVDIPRRADAPAPADVAPGLAGLEPAPHTGEAGR